MKKTLLTIVLTVLVCCTVMGTTLALLVAQSETVTNTFTIGDINITLEETTGNSYKMIPGSSFEKNPTVTVETGSEACWLFVKVIKENNFDAFMTFEMADGWEALSGQAGVYYRKVTTDADNGLGALTAEQEIPVIKNNTVQVLDTVTQADLTGEAPKLSFAAAAVQLENVDEVETAWDEVKTLLP